MKKIFWRYSFRVPEGKTSFLMLLWHILRIFGQKAFRAICFFGLNKERIFRQSLLATLLEQNDLLRHQNNYLRGLVDASLLSKELLEHISTTVLRDYKNGDTDK
jgi:hypothetical protein